jgi:pSer/pThr/pTyr-binding forkhead associated (FHA) protein
MMTESNQEEGRPWLEYFPEGSSTMVRAPLEKETLTIGRAESVDLQIDSTRVSREHARIVLQDGKYFLHDSDSTNGTHVNGQLIDQIELADGDVIVVADTEITFLTRSTKQLRNMATQPLARAAGDVTPKERPASVQQEAYDAILAVRGAHEALLQQLIPVDLKHIVELPDITPFACLVEPEIDDTSPDERNSSFMLSPLHLVIRDREARRWAAAEQTTTQAKHKRLVASLDPWEIHENDELLWHFAALRESLPGTDSLWAAVRASDVVDLPEVASFCRELQRLNIEIACHGFVGSESQILDLELIDPELLLLAPELTVDITNNSRHKDRLHSVFTACEQLQIRPVVHDVPSYETMRTCLELGYRLFVEEHTQPLPSLAEALRQEEGAEMLAAV